MYIIVVGGGKVGYYLTKTLLNDRHEVLLIERDRDKVETYSERFGSVILQGDGAEAAVLAMRVWIDQDCCTGAGLCVDHCPELFIVLEDVVGELA